MQYEHCCALYSVSLKTDPPWITCIQLCQGFLVDNGIWYEQWTLLHMAGFLVDNGIWYEQWTLLHMAQCKSEPSPDTDTLMLLFKSAW